MLKFGISFITLCLFILLFALVNNAKGLISKVIFSNLFTTLIAIFIVLLATIYKNPNLLDLSIMYILLGFVISACLLFFISFKRKES